MPEDHVPLRIREMLLGNMSQREDLSEKVLAKQEFVLEGAEEAFDASEIEDLRCLTRLAVEFNECLQLVEADARPRDYIIGSVVAGVDSFYALAHGYRCLVGATSGGVDWDTLARLTSPGGLREYYVALFSQLSAAGTLERKCRLVLDLFKLQLFFVSVSAE
jgi:hypothetical protein